MFIYIQEVNIVISQQICNFFLCFNLRQTLQYIIIELFDISIRWPVYDPNNNVALGTWFSHSMGNREQILL